MVPRVQNVFSQNGRCFVRIVPGATINTEDAASSVSTRARGEFFARQADRSYRLVADVPLRNAVSPAFAIVTDDGYLVTFDQWFRLGLGEVIAFYRPSGTLIRAVSIEELYTPDKLAQIPRSVSSRWWRCNVYYTPAVRGGADTMTVFDYFGGSFALNPRAGTFTYTVGAASCAAGRAMIF
jgi:hypothetical protein